MVLIGRNPKLIVDNNLNGLCDVVDEHVGSKEMAKYMIQKM
jgi:glutaredoxin-related protein